MVKKIKYGNNENNREITIEIENADLSYSERYSRVLNSKRHNNII